MLDLLGEDCKIISDGNTYPCKTKEEFFEAWKNVGKTAKIHHQNGEVFDWYDRNKALTVDVLTGNSTFLFHRLSNRVKKELFDRVSNMFGKDGDSTKPTLVSIGAGRGGDIWKWNDNFSKVLIVEPNADHIEELKKRLKENEERGKITFEYRIIQTNGQDVDTILDEANDFFGGAIDVVSFMLSLTFFNLEDKKQLKNLVKLASSGQVLMFFVTDAEILKENLDYEPKVISYTYEAGEFNISLTPGVPESKASEIFTINIPGSIVRDQKEFLFYPKKFLEALKKKPILEGYTSEDKNAILGDDEIWLSKMYYYAIVTFDK